MRLVSLVRTAVLPVLLATGFASAQLVSGGNFDVIRVGKVGITQGKVDSLTKMLAQQQTKGNADKLTADQMKQVRWAVIDNLVGQELLKLEIKKLGITAPKSKVDSLVKLFKSQYPSEDAFNKELHKTGATIAMFRERIEQQLASETILEKKFPYPKDPTDAEIAAYWELNKNKVSVNDTISGAQIFVKIPKGASAQEIADQKDMLKGLAAQVRTGKATFAMLAAQYSDDPSAKKTGGVMSKFIAKSEGADFAKGVANLKVGEISDVFQTKDGLHIFMLTEKNDGKMESYKYQIEYILRVNAEQDRQLKIKSYLDTLAKSYKVQYLNKDYTPSEAIGGN